MKICGDTNMRCEHCGGYTVTGNLNRPKRVNGDVYAYMCAGCKRPSRVIIKKSIKSGGISSCWRCGAKLSIGWMSLGGDMFHIIKDCPVCKATNED